MIEEDELYKTHILHLENEKKRMLSENTELIEQFIEHCKQKNINLSITDVTYSQKIGIVASYTDIVKLLFPSIPFDKDNLTDYKILLEEFKKDSFKEDAFEASRLMIMLHSYFRRGFYKENHFAPKFTELFCTNTESNVEKYIALDKDRVRIDFNGPRWFEKDTWFGANFTKEIKKVKDGIVKLRPPLALSETQNRMFFNNVYSLDIKWYTKDNIKVFQAEEFKNENLMIEEKSKTYYPARYIHAEYDLQENTFRHFDGAVHLYEREDYLRRRKSDINYNIKHHSKIKSNSIKLFKIDGGISLKSFIAYTSHFMSGNPLVFEYFEGKYPDHIENIVEMLMSKT